MTLVRVAPLVLILATIAATPMGPHRCVRAARPLTRLGPHWASPIRESTRYRDQVNRMTIPGSQLWVGGQKRKLRGVTLNEPQLRVVRSVLDVYALPDGRLVLRKPQSESPSAPAAAVRLTMEDLEFLRGLLQPPTRPRAHPSVRPRVTRRPPNRTAAPPEMVADLQQLLAKQFVREHAFLTNADGNEALGFSRDKNLLLFNGRLDAVEMNIPTAALRPTPLPITRAEVTAAGWSLPTDGLDILMAAPAGDGVRVEVNPRETGERNVVVLTSADARRHERWKDILGDRTKSDPIFLASDNAEHAIALRAAYPDNPLIVVRDLARAREALRQLSSAEPLRPANTRIINGLPRNENEVVAALGGRRGKPEMWNAIHQEIRFAAQANGHLQSEPAAGQTMAEHTLSVLRDQSVNLVAIVAEMRQGSIHFNDGSTLPLDAIEGLVGERLKAGRITLFLGCSSLYPAEQIYSPIVATYNPIDARDDAVRIFRGLVSSSGQYDSLLEQVVAILAADPQLILRLSRRDTDVNVGLGH